MFLDALFLHIDHPVFICTRNSIADRYFENLKAIMVTNEKKAGTKRKRKLRLRE